MNNSKIALDSVRLDMDETVDLQPTYRTQATQLSTIVEALEKVSESSFWNVLNKEIFSADLVNLRSRLGKEKDTAEIFRLQGEIARCEKYDINKLLLEKRNQLTNLKNKIDD